MVSPWGAAAVSPGCSVAPPAPAVASTMRLSALLSAARPRLPPGYRHGLWPPDSTAARVRNPPGQRRRKVFVEPVAEDDWKVFKGDTVRLPLPRFPPPPHTLAGSWLGVPPPPLCSPPQVQVLAGKDAGRKGMVTQVVKARNWVVVEGLNTVRPEQGGLQEPGGTLGSSRGYR